MNTKQIKYEALVRAYADDLFRYGYWLCRDKSVTEDLVQETFLRAWKNLDSLQNESAAKSWLITILRRENARRFERKQFDYTEYDEASLMEPSESSFEAGLENQWLRQQIFQLESEYREPLLLQVVGGFTGDEIADILQLNKNTVMTRLFRARNFIKEKLDTNESKGVQNG
jgi:RNA polymerase sigma-70 factor (ECF subfamily)